MRRAALFVLVLLVAAAAGAASPFYLDRSGVLWNATSAPEGLVLTGERDGSTVVQSTIPFEIGLAGMSDTQIQVAADETTGKVAVVWQRNWSDTASEIIAAVWNGGTWERIEHLTEDFSAHPRFPAIQLTQATSTIPDPSYPDDPAKSTIVKDSFLNVIWWEGVDSQHGTFAALRLTADPTDPTALTEKNLDSFVTIGIACDAPVPPEVLEHPLFAAQTSPDQALMFFGSDSSCLFYLVKVSGALEPASGDTNLQASVQRRRHTPVFGVSSVYATTGDLDLDGARIVLGANLKPVAYRVDGGTIEYVVATDTGWSPRRTLVTRQNLTLDQAIPLVEGLAR